MCRPEARDSKSQARRAFGTEYVSMCLVCACICASIHVFILICTRHTRVDRHIWVCLCIYPCVGACSCTYVPVVCACVSVCECVYVYACVYMYVYWYVQCIVHMFRSTYVYVCVLVSAHAYMCMCVSVCLCVCAHVWLYVQYMH